MVPVLRWSKAGIALRIVERHEAVLYEIKMHTLGQHLSRR
jgi:hypothetical protein